MTVINQKEKEEEGEGWKNGEEIKRREKMGMILERTERIHEREREREQKGRNNKGKEGGGRKF